MPNTSGSTLRATAAPRLAYVRSNLNTTCGWLTQLADPRASRRWQAVGRRHITHLELRWEFHRPGAWRELRRLPPPLCRLPRPLQEGQQHPVRFTESGYYGRGEHCANTVPSVLTECWNHDGTPNKYNFRHECAKLMQAHAETVPWFGLEQEYTLLDLNDRPYGWPQNVCDCFALGLRCPTSSRLTLSAGLPRSPGPILLRCRCRSGCAARYCREPPACLHLRRR